MKHGHSYKKAPHTKVVECSRMEPGCLNRDIEIILRQKRDRQRLSLKQAENLAKRLLRLVDEAKVSQVMDS